MMLARPDPWSGALAAVALLAAGSVAVLLAVIAWLSFVYGLPGDPKLAYGLGHYREVLLDPFTWRVLGNTVLFSTVTLVVALLLGVPLAWLVERTDIPGKPAIFTGMTLGLLIPGFAVALGWVFLLDPRIGVLNQVLMSLLSLEEAPVDIGNLAGMGLVEGLSLSPVAFIMTSVVFRNMDASLEESARMCGASGGRTLLHVTLPLALPGIAAAAIYVFAIGFSAFDVPAVIGLSRRIYTFSTYVFQQVNPTEGVPEHGGVATLAMIMVALAIGLSIAYQRLQRGAPRYAVITGRSYRTSPVKLGRWRGPALAAVAAYFVATQLLPLVTLVWASLLPYVQAPSVEALDAVSMRNYGEMPRDLVVGGLKNTTILMLLVPTFTLIASVAVSWVVVRTRMRGRGVLDFLAFLPHTVPGIVFSVAAWLLALFVLRGVLPIYGTIWILVLVYAIVRMSYGTRMTNSALIQVHRELEESARMSGAGTGVVLRRVLLPLIRPALVYAWIWIALLTYRELTLPVILATAENQPLSVVVWSMVSTSSYGMASAVSVIMLALMLPVLLAYWLAARRAGVLTA